APAPAPASAPAPAPAPGPLPDGPPVEVRVIDGDTEAAVPGAAVEAIRGGVVVSRAETDAEGRAEVPLGTAAVTAAAAPFAPARERVREGAAEVELYDPRLQSPEYGGDSSRERYVAGVRVPPPRGEPAWTFESRTLIEFPPAVRDGLVVFGTNSGRVYALHADDGELAWARRQKGEIASTPAIDGGSVYVSSMDGTLTAYGAGAGVPLWSFSTDGSPIESSPLVADGLVYVGTWAGGLHAVDAATGEQRWRYQAPDDIKGSAALANGLIVVGDYSGNVHALDPATGAERWTYTGGTRFYGGPAVRGDTIVIGDVGGAVIGIDARSGAERWRHSTGGSYVYSSPAIADGAAYVGSYNGTFQALELTDGSVRWSFDVGGRISGSATVVDGVVYTARLYAPGQARRTYGLDTRTGAVRFEGEDGRYSPAVGAGRTLYLIGTRHVYAHPAPTP
ncbi:MAG TPA: PQQ-binding-like beta-propeller repeat protein, partial [Miltoncostaeaceae bacterium]|nr:PQQ-binding-like beta-propeller repeat protein [Miltoncostaeaceae bacterium]